MKKSILIITAFIFFTFNAFTQPSEDSPEGEASGMTMTDDDYFPILGDNSAFGYGDGNIFVNTSLASFGEGELYGHFLNAGISESFSMTFGMLNMDFYDPEILYLTPEFHFPVSENVTIGAEIIGAFPASELGDFIINPSFIVSFGSNTKHLSIGYGIAIDSEGEFYGMSAIDLVYAVAGIRLNGRLPVSDNVGIFTKNDYSSEDGSTILLSRTGVEGRLGNVNVYGGINLSYIKFDFFGSSSNTEVNFLIGASYRIGG